jgi:hypothetical protein
VCTSVCQYCRYFAICLVDLLSVKPLEDYASTSELLKATVVGEFFECLRRLSRLPFGAVFMFVEEAVGKKTQVAVLARIMDEVGEIILSWREMPRGPIAKKWPSSSSMSSPTR